MPTRAFLQHVTSPTAPTGPQQGDEWFNPSTNVLSKYVITNGTSPSWQIPVFANANGTITTVGTFSGIIASGTAADIPVFLVPKGANGYLSAAIPDNTLVGGNVRGFNAVDWQMSRTSPTQVAAFLSVIGGGSQNTSSGYASTTVGGESNTNSAYNGFIGGGSLNSLGGNAQRGVVVGGVSNTANGHINFIGGGALNSGTSGVAVTTQSATMNGTTAVTLSGSNANIRVGQLIQGTSIQLFPYTYVAAISGTSLTLSQNASGSSTSTLSFFTPHGVVVGGGNNQATGAYSFIGGGGDAGTAANRNVASGDWSFVGGGQVNIASGIGSAIVGGGTLGSTTAVNTASGSTSFIGAGFGNTASGTSSSVLGARNTANGEYSSCLSGRRSTTRNIAGYAVFSGVNPIADVTGVSQSSIIILGRQTTDATPTVLCSDSNVASAFNQVILPDNSAYFFTGEIVAGVTGGGNTKGWTIEGVIKRGAGVGTTAIVGSPTVTSSYADAGASAWTIAVTADTTNGGLRVTFTGQAGTTIRCVAQIRTTEMTY